MKFNMTDYTRIPSGLSPKHAEKMRRVRNKPKEQKNTNSHENFFKNKTAKNNRIRDGIRAKLRRIKDEIERGVSNIDLQQNPIPPAPSISHREVIQFFPEQVYITDDEEGNEIHLPFTLLAWRDLADDKIKPYFYQLAMADFEVRSNNEYRLVPFVFNESKALTRAIDGQALSRVEYLRDRLQKALKTALQRPSDDPVMFWFAFETNIKGGSYYGQPHYQGSILLRPSELRKARHAFYKLNRKMTPEEKHGALRFRSGKRKQTAAKYGQIYADLNWADYNLKERALNRIYYTDMGNIVAATQALRNQAGSYYKRLRDEFKLLS